VRPGRDVRHHPTSIRHRGIELVAHVFFQHYAPRMSGGAPLDATGWFAPERALPGRS
jgi:hypothetical protein